MLISISEVLKTPVSTLLGETVLETKVDDLKAISEKLEIINLQLAQLNSPYLSWNYNDPETAVLGVGFHIFE